MTNKEAIEKLKGILTEATEYENSVCYVTEKDREPLEMAIKALENQKTGHWEENAPEWQNVDPPYICSECGNFHLRKTNYCDQCGAKMIESQESEDKE